MAKRPCGRQMEVLLLTKAHIEAVGFTIFLPW